MKWSIGWVFITAAMFLLGFGLGLVITWIILPVRMVDTTPGTLQQDIKARYRVLIAEDYLVTGDRTRAVARLDLLNDKNVILAISDQVTNNKYVNEEQRVALVTLQGALAGPQVSQIQTTATSTAPILVTPSLPAGIITVSPSPTTTTGPVNAPTPFITASPASFIIISRNPVCDTTQASPILQVYVIDSSGEPLNGIVLIVRTEEGLERIITGLKPDDGAGSADISLSEGTIYTITIENASGSPEILTTAQCTSTSGASFPGGWKLQIQY